MPLHSSTCTGSCGAADSSMSTIAGGILKAANKYQLPHLMVMCEKELEKMIKAENVMEILQLADEHRAKNLKSKSLTLIKSHSSDLYGLAGWKEMKETTVSSFRALYVEILEYMYATPSSASRAEPTPGNVKEYRWNLTKQNKI